MKSAHPPLDASAFLLRLYWAVPGTSAELAETDAVELRSADEEVGSPSLASPVAPLVHIFWREGRMVGRHVCMYICM